MKKKIVLLAFVFLLFSTAVIVRFVSPVVAEGPIYIRADGSVEGTDKIQRDGNVYTLTDNIYGSIVVERDNIVIDGAGYILQGTGSGTGMNLTGRSDVTIKNTEIKDFNIGIWLHWYSHNNFVSGNKVTHNVEGIRINWKSGYNNISGNFIANNEYGIYLTYSDSNSISENIITTNSKGLWLFWSGHTNVFGNTLTNNNRGIEMGSVPIHANNVLRNNRLDNNEYNFYVGGGFVHDIDASNTVNGRPVYYWVNQQDKTVPSGAGYVALIGCTGITVQNLNLAKNGQGILLVSTKNSTIARNNITDNAEGIYLKDSSNNKVFGNNITSNGQGIYISHFSNNTIIADNTVTLNSEYGIHIDYYSDNNIVTGNYVTNNNVGIRLYRSINNTLRNNRMNNNKYNFEVWYIFVSRFINDIDTSNTVNGKPIYHWIGERDKTVPSGAGYVALINCTGITVQNLNLANNKDGILIISTKNSTITGNNIMNCIAGIYLDHSSSGEAGTYLGPPSSGIAICENNIMNNVNGIYLSDAYENTIYRNNIINNSVGIYFMASEKNKIYHNNFINNTGQVGFSGFWMPPFAPARVNTWDDGYPSGGNYWSDYEERYPNATELDGSGIWNTSYILAESNQDNYPVMNPVVIPEFPDEEPFPTWIVAAIVIIAVVGAALLVYFRKIKKTTGEVKRTRPEGVM